MGHPPGELELTEAQRGELAAMGLSELASLRQRLKQHRAGPGGDE